MFHNALPNIKIVLNTRKVKVIQGYLVFDDEKTTYPQIIVYTCHNKDILILIHEMLHLEQWLNKCPIMHNKEFKAKEIELLKKLKQI